MAGEGLYTPGESGNYYDRTGGVLAQQKDRVREMNKFYGTTYDDVGDFSQDQFGYWHTQWHSDKYDADGTGGDYYMNKPDTTPDPTPDPTPTPTPSPSDDDTIINENDVEQNNTQTGTAGNYFGDITNVGNNTVSGGSITINNQQTGGDNSVINMNEQSVDIDNNSTIEGSSFSTSGGRNPSDFADEIFERYGVRVNFY